MKAFGIIETKFPDGHVGFSFIIVISAEFTPIQLGFGFTLNGVGGSWGSTGRSERGRAAGRGAAGVDGERAVPARPIEDAPSIMQRHGAAVPCGGRALRVRADGDPGVGNAGDRGGAGDHHRVPGAADRVLGTVQVAAAGAGTDATRWWIHLDIGGGAGLPEEAVLAGRDLHDSNVGASRSAGDMAARIDWGDNPNLALAIGGFNPHFTPPAGFPKLRRLTIDLGVKREPDRRR